MWFLCTTERLVRFTVGLCPCKLCHVTAQCWLGRRPNRLGWPPTLFADFSEHTVTGSLEPTVPRVILEQIGRDTLNRVIA